MGMTLVAELLFRARMKLQHRCEKTSSYVPMTVYRRNPWEQYLGSVFVMVLCHVQHALKRTQDAALERLTVAATEGDLDSVKNLLARGLPINQV
jgi:hypothetical protein